ncbi:MAG: TIGR04063 family PEP-CTERM/XrtA system glycosyltransferase [Pseudomonadota bacterium]
MRILHVFDHSIPLHSGYTFRSRAILQHQRALGWETHHLTSPKHVKEGTDPETVDGFTFYRTKAPTGRLSQLPALGELAFVDATAKRLETVAREVKPDLLHAHSPVLNAMAASRVSKKLGIPFVYEIRAFWEDAAAAHGTCREGDLRYRATRFLESRALRAADGVATICEGLKSDIIARGINEDKIVVIPNAVDTDRFSGPSLRNDELAEKLTLADKPVLGFIGSFYDYEGLDGLITAMPLMLNQNPKLRLLLVGGGPEDERLRAQAARLGLNDAIIFTGRIPHDQVEDYYGLVDLFVYPRKAMRLTELVTPLKPLEAMAQHKLVAASDIGGHRELIEDGRTGVLFAPDQPEALAAKVLNLLSETDHSDMLAAARHYVEHERTWRHSIDNYVPLFERITGDR